MSAGGELNEISQAIGALQQAEIEAARQRDAMWRELKAINAKLPELTALADAVAEMKPAVEDWKLTKQRGLGYLACAGLAGSAITATLGLAIGDLLKKWGWL